MSEFTTPEEQARRKLLTLVREYGRERYRHGKADVRSKTRQTRPQRKQSAKARIHSQEAAAVLALIEKTLYEGPYL